MRYLMLLCFLVFPACDDVQADVQCVGGGSKLTCETCVTAMVDGYADVACAPGCDVVDGFPLCRVGETCIANACVRTCSAGCKAGTSCHAVWASDSPVVDVCWPD